MTPQDFIRKWKANTRAERAAAQEHFIDLCRLLGEPTPNEDPDGATYAFEKGATKATGGEGWADVWRRGRFAWEYKGKHKDLEAAHRQLLLYAGALENPPLLITSDIERIVIRTNWTGYASERHDILLDELADPARLKIDSDMGLRGAGAASPGDHPAGADREGRRRIRRNRAAPKSLITEYFTRNGAIKRRTKTRNSL